MTQELHLQRPPDILKADPKLCTDTAIITAKGTDTINGPSQAYREFKGMIIHHNTFGATIDILVDDILAAGYEIGDILSVAFANGFKFDAALVTNFSEVAQGYFVQARRGKHPTFGIKYGDLAQTAGLAVGDGITFGMKTKAGFLAALESRQLVRTDTRADYPSDAAFANFREMTTTGLGRGKLFRGGHPLRPDLSRAPYAATLMQAAGVNTVINMCDTEAGLAGLLDKSNPHASSFYQSLVDKGSVVTLNLGLNFADAGFAGPLITVLRFMTTHPAPYYLHCKSGKDRTGYVCALLEALAGATQAEIEEDYMASYVNHFGVEAGTARYNALVKENVVPMLQHITGGADKLEEGVDLAVAAKTYLGKCGMSVAEIAALCNCIEN